VRRLLPATIGLLLGSGFGLAWWFLWGCRVCAPGSTPWGPMIFSTVMGAVLGEVLGKDYVRH